MDANVVIIVVDASEGTVDEQWERVKIWMDFCKGNSNVDYQGKIFKFLSNGAF